MTPAIDWVRATVIGALAGAALWAVAVYALISFEGAAAVWWAVGIVLLAVLGVGVVMYRRTTLAHARCYAVGMILAPFVGLVPSAVFLVAGLIVNVVVQQ